MICAPDDGHYFQGKRAALTDGSNATLTDIQTFLKMRQLVSMERTQLINHVCGLLAEYGIVLNKGATELRRALPALLEDAENELTDTMRALLYRQYTRLVMLDDELEWYNAEQKKYVHQDPVCKRLLAIPGFDPLVSQAIKAGWGTANNLNTGEMPLPPWGWFRGSSVPVANRFYLSITKCGNQYVRSMLVHGARAVLFRAAEKTDPLSVWVNRIREKRGFNRAIIALANKLLRISWVIIARNELYSPVATENQ